MKLFMLLFSKRVVESARNFNFLYNPYEHSKLVDRSEVKTDPGTGFIKSSKGIFSNLVEFSIGFFGELG